MYNEGLNDKIHSLAENELESDEFSFRLNGVQNSETRMYRNQHPVVEEIVLNPGQNKQFQSSALHNQGIRKKWYQTYTVPDTYVDLNVDTVEVIPEDVKADLSAFEALWSMERGVDTRPHIYDKKLKQFLLLDSGAQISACPPDPGDQPDPTMTLRAANGSKMKCFGTKKLTVQINRKEYSIQAIKTEVKSPILGWNFVKKHRLGF